MSLKRFSYVFLVLFVVCAMSSAAFAAEHTMSITADKYTVEKGKEVKVSITVVLGDYEKISSISSVMSYDMNVFSTTRTAGAVNRVLMNVEGGDAVLDSKAALVSVPNLIGGSVVTTMPFADITPFPAGTYVTLKEMVFTVSENAVPGDYEFILPEHTDPNAPTSNALWSRTSYLAMKEAPPSSKVNLIPAGGTKEITIKVVDEIKFTPVTGITLANATTTVGVPLTLEGTVAPAEATYSDIKWSVKSAGTTGANITDGNKLNATGAGTATVTATIDNGLAEGTPYTKDFDIKVNVVPVTGITLAVQRRWRERR